MMTDRRPPASVSFCVPAALILLVAAVSAPAQEDWNAAAETVVVFNRDFAGSEALARYYAEKRAIPSDQVVGLRCATTDDISRAEFESSLQTPLRRLFDKNKWWTRGGKRDLNPALATRVTSARIRVLVLMRGVPFRVTRATDPKEAGKEDEAAVDSELMLLGMEPYALPGFIPNPWFKSPLRFSAFDAAPGLLLVGRLDGPDDATVRRLIDDALAAESAGLSGRSVIDLALKDGAYEMGENWLRECAKLHRLAGIPVYADRNADVIPAGWPLPDTMLYFGWYRDRVSGAFEDRGFRFVRGAVACHLHSFSAARLRAPDEHWTAPLLQRGVAATMGNVWEPYLPLTCHFDILNRRLLEGVTLAEAAWAATPGLSWMQVVIGDPLYRPFRTVPSLQLGDEGRARDYALFRTLVTRHAEAPDSAEMKKQLLRLAEKRQSPHLLELLALHCWNTGNATEAADLLDHAASIATIPEDRDRLRLYQAEALRQNRQFDAAREILNALPKHPAVEELRAKLP